MKIKEKEAEYLASFFVALSTLRGAIGVDKHKKEE